MHLMDLLFSAMQKMDKLISRIQASEFLMEVIQNEKSICDCRNLGQIVDFINEIFVGEGSNQED